MTTATSIELCIVIPVYNESDNLTTLLTEWHPKIQSLTRNFRFLMVNDGSTDHSLELLKTLETRFPNMLILDKPNSGHGKSCRLGYETACRMRCEWVLQIDSDGQCDPRYFERFWNARAQADCVFGKRIQRDDGIARKIISTLCSLGVLVATGVYGHDVNVPYRLIRQSALETALKEIPPKFNMQNIALTVALRKKTTLLWKWIPIHFPARQGGINSLNVPKAIRMGWHMLREIRSIAREKGKD